MKVTTILLLPLSLSLSLAASGCATDDGSMDVAETPLAGTVGGQTWTFAMGQTDAFLSQDGDNFFAELYPTTFTTCGFSEPTGNHILASIPKVPGEYDMTLGRGMTFVVGDSQNLVTLQGKIIVDEVTPTLIKGGLAGSYDGQNSVTGQFALTVCPDMNLSAGPTAGELPSAKTDEELSARARAGRDALGEGWSRNAR
jgi:hypothetical protein